MLKCQQRASADRSRASAPSISTSYLYCNCPWTQHRPWTEPQLVTLVQLVELQRPPSITVAYLVKLSNPLNLANANFAWTNFYLQSLDTN